MATGTRTTLFAQPALGHTAQNPVLKPVFLGVTAPAITCTVPMTQAVAGSRDEELRMKTLIRRAARLTGLTVGLAGLFLALNAIPGAATPSVGFSSQPLGRGTLATHGSLPLRQGLDIVAVKVTLSPGGSSGWHTHPGGGITIVVQGALTVYSSRGNGDGEEDARCVITRYAQGQAFLEIPGEVVDAVNTGLTDTILTVIFPGVPVGGSSRIDRPNPGTCVI
jgi:hypothetical protein